jgi:hypothetical protein
MANTDPHLHAQDRPGKAVDINPVRPISIERPPTALTQWLVGDSRDFRSLATVPWEAFDPTHPDHAEWVEDVGRCLGTHDHAEWVAAGCPVDDED